MARILLVEDDPSIAQVVGLVCQAWGHEVTTVDNGRAALTLTEREPFDLVLMDSSMPGMDGISLARAIRANSTTRHLPLIGLTAKAFPHEQAALLAAGVDQVVTKPFDPDTLRTVIEGATAQPRHASQPGCTGMHNANKKPAGHDTGGQA